MFTWCAVFTVDRSLRDTLSVACFRVCVSERARARTRGSDCEADRACTCAIKLSPTSSCFAFASQQLCLKSTRGSDFRIQKHLNSVLFLAAGTRKQVKMSWEGYITNLISAASVEDAVIAGCEPGQESVWASHPDGWLKGITPEEVKHLMSQDRVKLLQTGVTLAGRKCTVLRDLLFIPDDYTMDVKMKISDTEPIPLQFTIGKSHKALVIVRGGKGATGGNLNLPVFKVIEHLRKVQY